MKFLNNTCSRACALALSLLLLSSLTFSTVACGTPKRSTLENIAGQGVKFEALLDANSSLPDTLLEQKVIDQAQHDQLASLFVKAKTGITAFNAAMKDVLASPAPTYAEIIPKVADLITTVQGMRIINNPTYDKVLVGVEAALRVIANYFAVNSARLEQYLREYPNESRLERPLLAIYGIPRERMKQARAIMLAEGLAKRERAACAVLGVTYTAEHWAAIESFAGGGA
ncbi:MAG: hypothetical protein WCB68_12625 [Pyrinomonadaceae bacterium]